MALNAVKCNHLTSLGLKGLNYVFAPIKWLAGKIVLEMTYNVSSGMLNHTVPYRTYNFLISLRLELNVHVVYVQLTFLFMVLYDTDRYSAQMTELFTEVYNQLPLCHCINNKILVSIHVLFCWGPQVTSLVYSRCCVYDCMHSPFLWQQQLQVNYFSY